MDIRSTEIARFCLAAAEADTLTFPEIVGALMDAGFEGYAVDFRAARATYYRPDGSILDLPTHAFHTAIADKFDLAPIQAAIRAAQTQAPGYSYQGFCRTVAAAGCASYLVSFLGRRAVYLGRTGESHVELFPS
ncbi:DUF1398 family protein [Aquabacter sp. L1I39]|uniref:DUF1398 domain-containing protein n=1 Tax=Aquabacter sp. L1I39 TaxID=2820278 RepID=UPI001ADA5A98|nr:DUF1398 family protein [Aquabacter sp. L1I39]QTL03579.1 DUF1398 family protein [Aquabacter sp. L1I39]